MYINTPTDIKSLLTTESMLLLQHNWWLFIIHNYNTAPGKHRYVKSHWTCCNLCFDSDWPDKLSIDASLLWNLSRHQACTSVLLERPPAALHPNHLAVLSYPVDSAPRLEASAPKRGFSGILSLRKIREAGLERILRLRPPAVQTRSLPPRICQYRPGKVGKSYLTYGGFIHLPA